MDIYVDICLYLCIDDDSDIYIEMNITIEGEIYDIYIGIGIGFYTYI